jgi:hypothetical protein
MSYLLYPGPSLSLHTALLSYPYTLFHTLSIYRSCLPYLLLLVIFVSTLASYQNPLLLFLAILTFYMYLLLYPGPYPVPIHVRTVMLLSYSTQSLATYSCLQSFTLLVIRYYLAYVLTCPFYCTPAYTLSICTYLLSYRYLLYNPLLLMFLSLLVISRFTCLILIYPGLSTYVHTALLSCYYASLHAILYLLLTYYVFLLTFTCLIYCTPAYPLYVLTVLHTCYYLVFRPLSSLSCLQSFTFYLLYATFYPYLAFLRTCLSLI